jgi:hypothetical protein
MMSVRGSWSFLASFGSRGTRLPSCRGEAQRNQTRSPREKGNTNQFDDFDENPIVGGRGENLEELRGQT